MVALRIDIDTLYGLAKGVPHLLDVLGERGIRASFYYPVGWEGDLISVLRSRFIRSGRKLAIHAAGRNNAVIHALSIVHSLLFAPRFSTHAPSLRRIIDEGHELGVHGYVHARWRNPTDREIANEVRMMCLGYEKLFGVRPAGFATPFFFSSPAVYERCEEYGIRYVSSTFTDSIRRHGDITEIPVTADVIHHGTPLPLAYYYHAVSTDDTEALCRCRKHLASLDTGLVSMHIHPKDEGTRLLSLFERVLDELMARCEQRDWTLLHTAETWWNR
jgi:peptidoglycan/xylan/chitin deacetylase (PgdA/CDA1 family)